MARPILPWNATDDADDQKLVWHSKLDNRYLIEVQRTSSHKGALRVFDHQKRDKEIFSCNVSLLYGAPFGPDISDVADWQNKIVDFIDNTYSKQQKKSRK